MTMVNKGYVEGTLVDITPTHYVTKDDTGITTWSREHYKIVSEPEPQTLPTSEEGQQTAEQRRALNQIRTPIKANVNRPRHPYDRDFPDE
jgi:hypothetical protein